MNLRILSYNIHKGYNLFRTRFTVAEIRDYLRQTGADIVFLQEVQEIQARRFPGFRRERLDSKLEFLADEVWPHFAYGKNAIYQNGHHGNAILSKFPFVESFNTDLSQNRFEKRGLLHGRVRLGGDVFLDLFNSHLDLLHGSRTRQLRRIIEMVGTRSDQHPLILAGDFNDWRNRLGPMVERDLQAAEVHRTVHGRPGLTFPSVLPLVSLDRVFVRGFRVESAWVGHGMLHSDHLPLVAEIQLLSK